MDTARRGSCSLTRHLLTHNGNVAPNNSSQSALGPICTWQRNSRSTTGNFVLTLAHVDAVGRDLFIYLFKM